MISRNEVTMPKSFFSVRYLPYSRVAFRFIPCPVTLKAAISKDMGQRNCLKTVTSNRKICNRVNHCSILLPLPLTSPLIPASFRPQHSGTATPQHPNSAERIISRSIKLKNQQNTKQTNKPNKRKKRNKPD